MGFLLWGKTGIMAYPALSFGSRLYNESKGMNYSAAQKWREIYGTDYPN